MKTFSIFCLFFFICNHNTFSQKNRVKPSWERFDKSFEIGIGAGSSHYLGDIHPVNNLYSYISTVRWNASANATWHISPLFSMRLNASWLRISADDFTFTKKNLEHTSSSDFDLQFLRNLHFRNDIKEVALMGLINLQDGFYNRFSNRPNAMPYIMVGIAAYYNNPEARAKASCPINLGEWQSVNVAGAKSKYGINIPLGVGIRRKISNKIDISAEICYRITFNDALDDITNSPYPNATTPEFINRSTERYDARTGEDRAALFNTVSARTGFSLFSGSGNTLPSSIGYPNLPNRGEKGNDSYWTSSIKLHYYFDKNIKNCPN